VSETQALNRKPLTAAIVGGTAMFFLFPRHLERSLMDAQRQLATLTALVRATFALQGRPLTTADCKNVKPLYDAAKEAVQRANLRSVLPSATTAGGTTLQARNRKPINKEGCDAFLSIVYATFVAPLIAMKRYVFVPFDGHSEIDDWAQAWVSGAHGEKKGIESHKFEQGKKPFANIPLLSQIYILGHSKPGQQALGTSENLDGTRMNFRIVADRLALSGLDTQFWGKIKVYACSSGTAAGPDKSFAERFANYMRKDKKYTNCEYFGYNAVMRTPESFDLLGGKYTGTTERDEQQVIQDKAKARQQATEKHTMSAWLVMSDREQDAEIEPFYKETVREWMKANEQKASAVRERF
jgi:hypothetical protein